MCPQFPEFAGPSLRRNGPRAFTDGLDPTDPFTTSLLGPSSGSSAHTSSTAAVPPNSLASVATGSVVFGTAASATSSVTAATGAGARGSATRMATNHAATAEPLLTLAAQRLNNQHQHQHQHQPLDVGPSVTDASPQPAPTRPDTHAHAQAQADAPPWASFDLGPPLSSLRVRILPLQYALLRAEPSPNPAATVNNMAAAARSTEGDAAPAEPKPSLGPAVDTVAGTLLVSLASLDPPRAAVLCEHYRAAAALSLDPSRRLPAPASRRTHPPILGTTTATAAAVTTTTTATSDGQLLPAPYDPPALSPPPGPTPKQTEAATVAAGRLAAMPGTLLEAIASSRHVTERAVCRWAMQLLATVHTGRTFTTPVCLRRRMPCADAVSHILPRRPPSLGVPSHRAAAHLRVSPPAHRHYVTLGAIDIADVVLVSDLVTLRAVAGELATRSVVAAAPPLSSPILYFVPHARDVLRRSDTHSHLPPSPLTVQTQCAGGRGRGAARRRARTTARALPRERLQRGQRESRGDRGEGT